jgi:hypothetical protein
MKKSLIDDENDDNRMIIVDKVDDVKYRLMRCSFILLLDYPKSIQASSEWITSQLQQQSRTTSYRYANI